MNNKKKNKKNKKKNMKNNKKNMKKNMKKNKNKKLKNLKGKILIKNLKLIKLYWKEYKNLNRL